MREQPGGRRPPYGGNSTPFLIGAYSSWCCVMPASASPDFEFVFDPIYLAVGVAIGNIAVIADIASAPGCDEEDGDKPHEENEYP